jgi:hypothetical protein
MIDTTSALSSSPYPWALWSSILAFAGSVLASILAPIANLISSTEIQRKQREYEYDIKRLEAIQKTIDTQKFFLPTSQDIPRNSYQSEFEQIVNNIAKKLVLRDILQQSNVDSFKRLSLPWRLFAVPKQTSNYGRVLSFFFYWILWLSVIQIVWFATAQVEEHGFTSLQLASLISMLDLYDALAIGIQWIILVLIRFLAIRTATIAARSRVAQVMNPS